MKKKIVLSLALLCSESSCFADAPIAAVAGAAHTRTRTDFKEHSDVIKLVDGVLIKAAEIHDSLKAVQVIHNVQYITTYDYNGTKMTLKELVKKEHELTCQGVTKTDAQWIELTKAITLAKDDFNAKLKSLRKGDEKETDMQRNMKLKLISIFLKDQKRDGSLLANADKADEKEKMYAASGTEFFMFLNDLKHFLEDLTHSCTRAHAEYKELVKKAHEKKA